MSTYGVLKTIGKQQINRNPKLTLDEKIQKEMSTFDNAF